MASTAPSTPGTKRCPGFAGGIPPILPHEAPANLEHFNSNKSGKDGLSTRCRQCGNAYGKAWAAAKRAAAPQVAADAAALEHAQATMTAAEAIAIIEADAAPMPSRAQVKALVAEAAAEVLERPVFEAQPVRYHDELAERASNGEADGYSAEVIDGTTYALPINGTATTPEGQAALDVNNAAHAAARRKRDAERKRTERAAAKRAKDEAATGKA